jgi:hypothetical protein
MINPNDFFLVDKGFHRDLLLSNQIYKYEVDSGSVVDLQMIGQLVCKDFVAQRMCDDMVMIGSATYNNMYPNSDLDFLGIKKGVRNRRYYFKIECLGKIWPAEATIDNGKNKKHLRFRLRELSENPKEYIVPDPKCWAFIFPNIFQETSIMHKIAQRDAFEMLGSVLCVMLNDYKGGVYKTNPEELANRIGVELINTNRKSLFQNNRWERGLKANLTRLLKETLDKSPFWAEQQKDGYYQIVPRNGLVPRRHLYTWWANYSRFITLGYIGYLIDKQRYKHFPRFLRM